MRFDRIKFNHSWEEISEEYNNEDFRGVLLKYHQDLSQNRGRSVELGVLKAALLQCPVEVEEHVVENGTTLKHKWIIRPLMEEVVT